MKQVFAVGAMALKQEYANQAFPWHAVALFLLPSAPVVPLP